MTPRFLTPAHHLPQTLMFIVARTCAVAASLTFIASGAVAQLPPFNGVRPSEPRCHAIVNATVITAPGQKMEGATIVMRDGVIDAVGPSESVKVPSEARVWKGDGLTVYPGLIESALLIKPGDSAGSRGPNAYWNARVHPEVSMSDQPAPDRALRKELRGMGFAVAAVYPNAGEFRGTGTVIALADENEHVLTYRDRAFMAASFDSGGGGGGGGVNNPSAYPGSLMGAMALIRQSVSDAQWHAACRRVWQSNPSSTEPPLRNDSLLALDNVINRRQVVLFDASDELNEIRAAKLARELNLDFVLLGCGTEFRHPDEVVQTRLPLIVPLEFPRRPEVSTAGQADGVSLRDLMTWEQAPTNPRRLLKAGATIALTTAKLRSRSDFWANLRSAIKHGLTEDQALAALTTVPAKLLGIESRVGTIAAGMAANLVVVKGSIFDKEAKIRDTWVNGRRFEVTAEPLVQLKGSGSLRTDRAPLEDFLVDVDTVKTSVSIHLPDKKKAAAKKVAVTQDQISFVMDGKPFKAEGYVLFTGSIDSAADSISGTATFPDGSTATFVIQIKEKKTETAPDEKKDDEAKPEEGEAKKPEGESRAPRGDTPKDALSGMWTLHFEEGPEGMSVTLNIKLEGRAVTGTVNMMGRDRDISGGTFDPSTGKLNWTTEAQQGTSTTEATVTGDTMTGTTTSPRFTRSFTAVREGGTGSGGKAAAKEEEKFEMPPEQLNSPLGDYGLSEPPSPQNLLITNAVIWTSSDRGIIREGWMEIENGRIKRVDENPAPPRRSDAVLIDCRGKHVTPGMIDCHSHTGIDGGTNEGAQTNTAECRIADCIDPDDMNWYRELAGGTIAANQLHGSANPIGGQNSVVKIKWGALGGAEAFRIPDAIPGIKFALGENVKRSNGRYPNSRMGVETFIRDAFTAAVEYKAKWDRHLKLPADKRSAVMPPQRDLELDALVEILDHKRIVHCHSYRQDEILMLIRVADDFDFTIGTFQHVLEGYKVAEAITRHGAGASTFSDWWAYKIEVIDAIPYNGAIMHDVGITVSFNSDSDELARRMNTEAAKAVRYGGIEPAEALKFVTINPARQLRIDHRTGSLEPGKDADFVIWSGDPLSTTTRCEQTWIDGACYFSLDKDHALRESTQRERQRIIQKILRQAHGEPSKDAPAGSQTQPQTQLQTQPEPGNERKPGCCDEG